MRIPRFAFAALVMGIVALGSTLAVVKAWRARQRNRRFVECSRTEWTVY